jgi:hypothetical protein
MVNSINNGSGPQIQPHAGGSEKGSASHTITKATSLSQLRITAGEMRDVPVPQDAVGGKISEFVRKLSIGPDALSPGATQQEKTAVGARLRMEALDRTPLSHDEKAILDEIVSSIVGRPTR